MIFRFPVGNTHICQATSKALDGLFIEIADEERAIRKDPLGQASGLIKKVFGAL